MTPGLVSVIVPVFNRPGPLREAVASALAQSYRPIEILIVDDGSTDETGAVADRLAAEHAETIRVFHTSNGGPGRAREVGRRAARGAYLQYLDSDDLLLPRKLELQAAALAVRTECGVAYGICRETGPDGAERHPALRPSDRPLERMFPTFLAERWWNTPTPLYRAELCDAVGPWADLRLEEDWEYDARVAATGSALAYVPEPLVVVRELDGGKLSRGSERDAERLRHRARAHHSILASAERADVSPETPELARFSRELFLLARQCGAAGLRGEARSLFDAARRCSTAERRRGLGFLLYHGLASTVGWAVAGRLARGLDRIRSLRSAPGPRSDRSHRATSPDEVTES